MSSLKGKTSETASHLMLYFSVRSPTDIYAIPLPYQDAIETTLRAFLKVAFKLEKPEKEGFIEPGTIYIYNCDKDTENGGNVRRIMVRSPVDTFENVDGEIVDVDNGELMKGSIDKENIYIAKGKTFAFSGQLEINFALFCSIIIIKHFTQQCFFGL